MSNLGQVIFKWECYNINQFPNAMAEAGKTFIYNEKLSNLDYLKVIWLSLLKEINIIR